MMKKTLIILSLIATTGPTFANSYQIYSQPNKKASVIGHLNDQSNQQYVKIYQKNNWIEIANTNTGDVGWVNIEEFIYNQKQLQYQKMLGSLNAQYQQLQAQKEAFDNAYQLKMEQLKYQVNALHNRINNIQQQPKSTPNKTQVYQQIHAINIQTNKDRKTATITKEWLGKDGKIHKETKQVPLSELKKMSII